MIRIKHVRHADMQTLKRKVEDWINGNKEIEVISVSHDREHATSFTAWITYREIKKKVELPQKKKKLNIEGE